MLALGPPYHVFSSEPGVPSGSPCPVPGMGLPMQWVLGGAYGAVIPLGRLLSPPGELLSPGHLRLEAC